MPYEAIQAFAISLLISFFVTPILIRNARRLEILDRPNELKRYPALIPAVGGLAIYASIAVTPAIAILLNERIHTRVA